MTTRSEIDTRVVASSPDSIAGGSITQAAEGRNALERSAVRKGERVDRYLVLDRLGAGGMGEVLVAYDPQLDRRVALKLLRADSQTDDPHASARMLREAQALAKLSHPNVVAVHDVGTHRAQVYIAMEYVEGKSLAAWLRTTRPWKDVLSVLIAAGRGLAAAHAAGIVHRDFKPGNVMIGRDGRARVLDFGLARATVGSETPEPWDSGQRLVSHDFGTDLTQAGTVMGTPAYMAPEQFLGKAVGPAADQFAFCVTLHAALYGERPFVGSTHEELARAHTSGQVRDPPRASKVPKRLRAIVLRGLAVSPNARWPSMDVLLDELERVVRPTGRVVLLAALAAASIAAGSWTLYVTEKTPCKGAHERLTGVWDDDRRQEIADAFLAVDKPYADAALATATARMEGWANDWVASHTDTCEATHVRGEQSTELLDLRMACLAQRLEDFRALTVLFANADAAVVENAPQASHRLPSLRGCADVQALTGALRPPDDDAAAAVVESLRTQSSSVRALSAAGKYAEAAQRGERLLREAEALGYLPLVAEIANDHGTALERLVRKEDALRAFSRALQAAARTGYPLQEARALIGIISVAGRTAIGLDEVERLAVHADALLHRAGDPLLYRAQLELTHGATLMQKGELDEALAKLLAGLAHIEAEPELAPLELGARNNVGAIHAMRGDLEEALRHFHSVAQLIERDMGPQHPTLAVTLLNVGTASYQMGQLDGAWEPLERAREIWAALGGDDHPEIAKVIGAQAGVLAIKGDLDGALALHQEAADRKRKALGDRDASLAYSLNNVGDLLLQRGELERARPYFEEARDILVTVHGEEHPGLAAPLANLGYILDETGRTAEAIPLLERSLSLRAHHKLTGPDSADGDYWLARALWRTGERDRALELARRALENYPEVLASRRRAVREWLDAR